MLEKDVEKELVRKTEESGGMAWKFVSPGKSGVPDRIILLPNGKIGFVELKAPGEKMRPLQIKRKEQLEKLGFMVFTVDAKERIDGVLNEIRTI